MIWFRYPKWFKYCYLPVHGGNKWRCLPPEKIDIFRRPAIFGYGESDQPVAVFYLYRAFGFKGGLKWAPPDKSDIRANWLITFKSYGIIVSKINGVHLTFLVIPVSERRYQLTMKILIVIPTYNESQTIEKLIGSIFSISNPS